MGNETWFTSVERRAPETSVAPGDVVLRSGCVVTSVQKTNQPIKCMYEKNKEGSDTKNTSQISIRNGGTGFLLFLWAQLVSGTRVKFFGSGWKRARFIMFNVVVAAFLIIEHVRRTLIL